MPDLFPSLSALIASTKPTMSDWAVARKSWRSPLLLTSLLSKEAMTSKKATRPMRTGSMRTWMTPALMQASRTSLDPFLLLQLTIVPNLFRLLSWLFPKEMATLISGPRVGAA